jgi:hypothetical protein
MINVLPLCYSFQDTWDLVHSIGWRKDGNMLSDNLFAFVEYGALLKGLLRCASCDVGMAPATRRSASHLLLAQPRNIGEI